MIKPDEPVSHSQRVAQTWKCSQPRGRYTARNARHARESVLRGSARPVVPVHMDGTIFPSVVRPALWVLEDGNLLNVTTVEVMVPQKDVFCPVVSGLFV